MNAVLELRRSKMNSTANKTWAGALVIALIIYGISTEIYSQEANKHRLLVNKAVQIIQLTPPYANKFVILYEDGTTKKVSF